MASASLVQTNSSQRSFQPSMKRRMASTRSRTESKLPRRMAWRVMIPKKIPRRRYCSERCRKTAWRHRHPRARHSTVPRPDPVAQPGDAPRHGDVARDAAAEPPVAARAEPVTGCPHCARPIAVITLLVTPAAASVPAPGARHAY
jgi:hypothetical protein